MPRAPHTLLPRVMAAVQAWTLRPWYERAWFTWPLAWQIVSMAVPILIVVGGAMLLPNAQAAARDAASRFGSGAIGDVAAMARRAEATTHAARILWHALLEPFVAYAFALVGLMCLACAAFGTVLNRVAFGRT